MADRSIRVVLSATVAGYKAQMAEAASATKKLADSVDKNQVHIDKLSTAAVRGSAVIAAGLAVAGKAAIDWESDWAGVTKTVDGSTSQLAALEGQLRDMAKNLPASHHEIAAVAEAAGQLGIKTDDVAGFTKVMIDLGETTNLTADEAATSLAQFMNVMGTSADDVSRLGATIVDLGNKGASTERDIVQMGQRIAASGKSIGLSETDVLGFASALASVGVEAEAGGTAISMSFKQIDAAVRDGGDALDLIAETSGVTSEAFAQQWGTDAAGATQLFIEGLGKMQTSGRDANGVLSDLGMTGIRQSDSLMRLAQAGDLLAENLNNGVAAWDANSALAEEAGKRYETTEAQIQMAWNSIKDAAITAGASILPVVADVASGVADMADAFGSMPDGVQSAIVTLGAVAAAGLGIVGIGGKVVTSAVEMQGALKALGITSAVTGGQIKGAAIAAGGFIALFAGVAAIGALADKAFGKTAGSVEDFTAALSKAATTSKADLDKMFDAGVTDQFNSKVSDAASAFQALKKNSNWVNEGFTGLGKVLGGIDTQLADLRASFANVDEALVGMDPEKAAVAFQSIAEDAAAAGFGVSDLVDIFPGYTAQLQRAAQAAGDGKSSTEALTGAIDNQTYSAKDAADASAALASEIDAVREASNKAAQDALELSGSQMGVQAAIDDATASLKENGKRLDITSEKGRANRTALDDIASAALALRDSQRELGTSSKDVDSTMAKNRTSFIEAATSMGMGRSAANKLADAYGLIPEDVSTKVSLTGVDTATTKARNLRIAIDGLTGKTIYVKTIYTTDGAPQTNVKGVNVAKASGGPVWGPGSDTSDSILARLSNGEFVLRAWAVRQIGLSRLMYANSTGKLPAFAGGGPVAMASFDRSTSPLSTSVDTSGMLSAVRDGLAASTLRITIPGMQGFVDARIMSATQAADLAVRTGGVR